MLPPGFGTLIDMSQGIQELTEHIFLKQRQRNESLFPEMPKGRDVQLDFESRFEYRNIYLTEFTRKAGPGTRIAVNLLVVERVG